MTDALYVTADDSPWGGGIPVTTQSMIKTFRNCPREAYYKYRLRLHPKIVSKPLTRGKWFHALLEAYYKGEDWEAEHKRWSGRFHKLFDEEKESLGDLPRELDALMRSYLWHYGDPEYADYTDWTVEAVEQTIEAMMPNGHLFRGRVDMIVRNAYGLWIVDHKTHKRLPDWEFRMLDEQSPLYVWAARESGLDVKGFIWNYMKTESLEPPQVVKDGTRFYSKMGTIDYPTLRQAVIDQRQVSGDPSWPSDPKERARVKAMLADLKAQRWAPDAMPTSPLFRRDELVRYDDVIERVLATTMRTSDTMHSYDWTDQSTVERNVNSCKGWLCSYRSLSLADLINGDSTATQKREYVDKDPLAYYDNEEEIG